MSTLVGNAGVTMAPNTYCDSRGKEMGLSEATLCWLAERQRPGNWISIATSDEIPPEIIGWYRTILHMFQIAFAPEIQRRLESRQLGDDFQLFAAQVIQPEQGAMIIRLNGEVRGVMIMRVNHPVEKGEQVLVLDLRHLVSFDIEESELDSGHFTMFWNGSGWSVSFDFRSGRAKSAQMIDSARQFLTTARFAAANGYGRPSVDNLFSACELLSKATLVLHRSPAVKMKNHGSVHAAVNAWGRLGNVDKGFLILYNRMAETRTPARYDPAATVSPPTDEDFEIASRELDLLERRVAHHNAGPDYVPFHHPV